MKIFFVLFIFIASQFTLFSQSLSLSALLSHLNEEDTSTLLNGEAMSRISESRKNRTLNLVPQHQNTEEVREHIKEINPGIIYEILFFIANEELENKIANVKREQHAIVEDETRTSDQQSIIMIHYYNVLRDIEQFGSIKYQNLRDKNIHPLFNSSQRLKKNNINSDIIPSLNPIQLLQETAQIDTMYILQDMPPFGNVRSEYTYMFNNTHLGFVGTNHSYIKYKGLIVVRPKDMYLSSQTFRTKDGVLAYGLGAVKVSGLGVFFKSVIGNSFSSRMVGFFRWMNEQ